MQKWMALLGFLVGVAWSVGAGPELFRADWEAPFADAAVWQAMPGWLGNPCRDAVVTVERGCGCFAVPEVRVGMKWRRQLPAISLADTPWLVVSYRAEGLRTDSDDYFLYVDDGGPKETRAISLRQVAADGQWHQLSVDVSGIAQSDTVTALALQVQAAGDGGARVWVRELAFVEKPRPGVNAAGGVRGEPPAADWWLPLADTAWQPQPSWLANPGDRPDARHLEAAAYFTVAGSGRGMKWSCRLNEQHNLREYRYLSLRYRSVGGAPKGDYALCLLGPALPDGSDYVTVVGPEQLQHDARWHTLTVALGNAAAKLPEINGLAVQIQAGEGAEARLTIARLGLVNEFPRISVTEFLGSSQSVVFDGFQALSIPGAAEARVADVLEIMGVSGWPEHGKVSVGDIPFVLPSAEDSVCATGLRQQDTVQIPIHRQCPQVLLLVVGIFRGPEEPVFARGTQLTAIRETDRFRVQLDYTDGTGEACFPWNVTAGDFEVWPGAQVLCVFADPHRKLKDVRLLDRSAGAAFAVLAASCPTDDRRRYNQHDEEQPPVHPIALPVPQLGFSPPAAAGDSIRIDSGALAARISHSPLPTLRSLTHRLSGRELLRGGLPPPLYDVEVEGRRIPAEQFVREPSPEPGAPTPGALLAYRTKAPPAIGLRITVKTIKANELVVDAAVENLSGRPLAIGLKGPHIGPFVLGEQLDDNHYVYPQEGALVHNRPVRVCRRYGGRFPLQFMAACNPRAGTGLYLRTEDTAGIRRDYGFEKTGSGLRMWLEYPRRTVAPGEELRAVRTVVGAASGDWHDAFRAYTGWLTSNCRPRSPRQQWFREVFNFRQRFLHTYGPLYDAESGTYHFRQAAEEADDHFGGMEYLHLFDWGKCGRYGRIYGRTGDYSPYDYLTGGQEALRAAVHGVQATGTRVGLYIEGYLLQGKGRLGQQHGKDWQLINRRGQPVYWPGSTEMMMCPWVAPWREVQWTTYAAKARELGIDGMYLDQFGFANVGKDCWSTAHGHPVPGYAVLGERGLAAGVRQGLDAVREGIVLYTEEVPCDINTQFQDGSFSYHMRQCRTSRPWVPIHLPRFAMPSFKTFEILVCDQPVGCWAEGVKWVFFNGEGLWLEGPAETWFGEDTRAVIRKCHAILRQYRDAFTSDTPEPLVRTEMGGVYANLFPVKRKAAYTLYNARHRTVSGPVLAIPRRVGAQYRDAWSGERITPVIDGECDVLHATLEPRGVGCIVCTWPQ